jgi:hypothetical protein
MGQDPDAIRQDIEQTRAEMSETVEAIGYKADVPSRAKDAVSDKVENVKSKVSDTANRAKEAVTGTASRVGDATPSTGEVKQKTRQVAGMAKENPLGLAIGAAALGFAASRFLKASSSRRYESSYSGGYDRTYTSRYDTRTYGAGTAYDTGYGTGTPADTTTVYEPGTRYETEVPVAGTYDDRRS